MNLIVPDKEDLGARKSSLRAKLMLKQRVITAAIIGPLIILAIFKLSNPLLAIVFAAITLIGAWEWSNLVNIRYTTKKFLYVTLVGLFILAIWFFLQPEEENIVLLLASLWWVVVVVMLTLYQSSWLQSELLQTLLKYSGFIVLVPAWLALC